MSCYLEDLHGHSQCRGFQTERRHSACIRDALPALEIHEG